MVSKRIKIVCLVLLGLHFKVGFSQTKFEKEIRAKASDIPLEAIYFVDMLVADQKVKWFQETNGIDTTFEAKTNGKGKKYSIEFSINGELQDVEVEIDLVDVPAEVSIRIKQILETKFPKYRIEKVQIQYTGSPKGILDYLLSESTNTKTVIRYELIVVAKVDNTYRKYEYLFSETGDFLQNTRIVLKNTDHIEY